MFRFYYLLLFKRDRATENDLISTQTLSLGEISDYSVIETGTLNLSPIFNHAFLIKYSIYFLNNDKNK